MERLIAGICLTIAFVVMASVFNPGGSHAEDHHGATAAHSHLDAALPPGSSDPHLGLPSLGAVEDDGYRIEIYATDSGPRYTIIDLKRGLEVGTLLSIEQATDWFPDLHLPDMNIDDASGPVMMADPPHPGWRH